MVGAKTLYRSRGAVLGGVCAGLAEYFALDTVIVRVLTVALAVVTAGFAAVVYVALWLILPQAPQHDSVVDVAPESVHSEARGCAVDARAATRPASVSPGAPSGIGHIPPTPPRGARAAAVPPSAAQAAAQPAATVGPFAAPHAPGAPFSPETPGGASASSAGAPRAASAGAQPVHDASVRVMLFIGMTLLFAGFAGFFSSLVAEVRWWQFWPTMLVIVGVVALVVPPQERNERGWAVAGGIAALVLDEVKAKDDQDDGTGSREHDAGDNQSDRDERVVAELGGGVAVDERGDDLPHKGADRRERAHAGQDAQDGVYLNDEGDLLDLRGAGDAGVEFVSIHT